MSDESAGFCELLTACYITPHHMTYSPLSRDERHDEVMQHHLLIADLRANVFEPLVKVS